MKDREGINLNLNLEEEENHLKKLKKDIERDRIHRQAVVHRIVVRVNHPHHKNKKREISQRNKRINYLIDLPD